MRRWTYSVLITPGHLYNVVPTTKVLFISDRKADIRRTASLKQQSGCGGTVKYSGCKDSDGNKKPKENGKKEEKEEKKIVVETSTTTISRAGSRSSMSNLLQMIAQREDVVNKKKKKNDNNSNKNNNDTRNNKKKTLTLSSSTSSGCTYMAQMFTSAAATTAAKTTNSPRHNTTTTTTTTTAMRPKSENIVRTTPQSLPKNDMGVSATLVEKLRRNVLHKRLDWKQMIHTHPSLLRLPVWQQRSAWGARFLPSSAIPIPQQDGPALFVCSAPTGCGKSSLVPLMLLDAHWERLLQRIDAPKNTNCYGIEITPPLPFASATEINSNNNNNNNTGGGGVRAYVTEFAASSRVCAPPPV